MKFSKKIVKSYNALPLWIRLVIQSVSIALPFYFAALLSVQIQQIVNLANDQIFLLHAVIVIVLISIIVFITRLLQALQENVDLLERDRIQALTHAYMMTDHQITENLIHFRSGIQQYLQTNNDQDLIETIIASKYSIKELVNMIYRVVEAHFGNTGSIEEKIDFEVTFMTKSYIDNKITIVAWSNRDNRAPRSMLFRDQNPGLYEDTVTAQVYREPRPSCTIIQDTGSDQYHYAELYPGQKARIKSSVIYPVLDDNNQLLGTIVIHCDKTKFFIYEDQKYWKEFIEIFSKRIALEKIKLDIILSSLCGKTLTIDIQKPF